MHNTLKSLLLLMTALVTACQRNEKVETEDTAVTDPTEITFTAQQYKAAGIELGNAEYRSLSNAVKATGRLSLPPQNKASVSTPYGGIVKDINVSTGQLVAKGTVLARIENPDIITIQQDYQENAAQLNFLQADYQRQQELQKDNINSQKSFQQIEADYHAAAAKDKALSAKLRQLNIDPASVKAGNTVGTISITAPIAGYVQDIATNIGTFMEPNAPMFEIINNTDLHIDLHVFENDVRKISAGQKVQFTYTNAGQVSQSYTANVFAIDKEFDEHTQAVTVHAKIQNPQGIMLPGMYVDARIITEQDSGLAVPDEAIVSQGDDHFIFVTVESHKPTPHEHNDEEATEVKQELGDEHTFRRVTVTTSSSDLGYTTITPNVNLPMESRVVVKGAYALLSAMNKGGDEE